MNNDPVYTFAKWQITQGQLQTVLNLLSVVAAETRKETGNLFYNVHQDVNDDHTLILFEGYKNKEAVAAHRNSDYFQRIVAGTIVPLLENREVILATAIELKAQT